MNKGKFNVVDETMDSRTQKTKSRVTKIEENKGTVNIKEKRMSKKKNSRKYENVQA